MTTLSAATLTRSHLIWISAALACALSLTACGQRPKNETFRLAPCELAVATAVEKTQCAFVTPTFLQQEKPQLLIGRAFLPDEYRPGASPVILLSYSLWQRRFGADPAMVGRALQVDGKKHTVVGIFPR